MAEFSNLNYVMLLFAFVFAFTGFFVMTANYIVENYTEYEEPLPQWEVDNTNERSSMQMQIDILQIDNQKIKQDILSLKGYVCKVNYNEDLELQGYEKAEERLRECSRIGK